VPAVESALDRCGEDAIGECATTATPSSDEAERPSEPERENVEFEEQSESDNSGSSFFSLLLPYGTIPMASFLRFIGITSPTSSAALSVPLV